MTQENFAIACGVRRRAQVTYESDERSPDARYLEAASKIGVDIAYVVYGAKTAFKETLRLLVIEDLFFIMCFELGFGDEDVQPLVKSAITTAQELYKKKEDVGGAAPYLVDSVKDFLRQRTRVSPDNIQDCLDTDLLKTIIEQLESLLVQKNISFPPKKRALAIIMLYRAFTASGKIDPKMIEEAINLASQSAA